jgi:transcriptional regulator with XRE-family HTH domain
MIGNIESHRKKPGRETLKRLAAALEVSADWILTGDDAQSPKFMTNDPDEVRLLRQYRKLTKRQKQNLLKLVEASVEIGAEMEQ